MIDKIYVVFADGHIRRKDSVIRTYKTRESAEKYSLRLAELGSKIEVAEFSLTNVTEVKGSER